jgi:probable F420-dependent oxidoreductase
MKIAFGFANAGPFASPSLLTALATQAEAAGVESLWAVEHVVIPVGYRSTYPYDPSGKIPAPENVPLPDPLIALAYAAAVTRSIRLATGILILPQRHPLYVAKEAATLDVLSNGRFILGIGVGWLAEEFEALGIPFAERAGRTAEAVRALRALWSEGPCQFEGRYYRWAAVESNPKPVQEGGIPIVVGGHSEISARRAARYGDGYFPGVADLDRLRHLLGIVREECARVGRDPRTIEISAMVYFPDLDTAKRYQELGVHRLVVMPPAFDVEGLERGCADLHERLIARL